MLRKVWSAVGVTTSLLFFCWIKNPKWWQTSALFAHIWITNHRELLKKELISINILIDACGAWLSMLRVPSSMPTSAIWWHLSASMSPLSLKVSIWDNNSGVILRAEATRSFLNAFLSYLNNVTYFSYTVTISDEIKRDYYFFFKVVDSDGLIVLLIIMTRERVKNILLVILLERWTFTLLISNCLSTECRHKQNLISGARNHALINAQRLTRGLTKLFFVY